jgi:hypothetical protein
MSDNNHNRVLIFRLDKKHIAFPFFSQAIYLIFLLAIIFLSVLGSFSIAEPSPTKIKSRF